MEKHYWYKGYVYATVWEHEDDVSKLEHLIIDLDARTMYGIVEWADFCPYSFMSHRDFVRYIDFYLHTKRWMTRKDKPYEEIAPISNGEPSLICGVHNVP